MRKRRRTNNDPTTLHGEFWENRIGAASTYGERSYVASLLSFIKDNRIYRIWVRILALFRHFRMITYISTFVSYALALIGTGALLLVFISATLLFLAASSILIFLFLLLTSFDARNSDKLLSEVLGTKNVYLFFADGVYPLSKNSFFFMIRYLPKGFDTVMIPRLAGAAKKQRRNRSGKMKIPPQMS